MKKWKKTVLAMACACAIGLLAGCETVTAGTGVDRTVNGRWVNYEERGDALVTGAGEQTTVRALDALVKIEEARARREEAALERERLAAGSNSR